jgi:hypothetical protein
LRYRQHHQDTDILLLRTNLLKQDVTLYRYDSIIFSMTQMKREVAFFAGILVYQIQNVTSLHHGSEEIRSNTGNTQQENEAGGGIN